MVNDDTPTAHKVFDSDGTVIIAADDGEPGKTITVMGYYTDTKDSPALLMCNLHVTKHTVVFTVASDGSPQSRLQLNNSRRHRRRRA